MPQITATAHEPVADVPAQPTCLSPTCLPQPTNPAPASRHHPAPEPFRDNRHSELPRSGRPPFGPPPPDPPLQVPNVEQARRPEPAPQPTSPPPSRPFPSGRTPPAFAADLAPTLAAEPRRRLLAAEPSPPSVCPSQPPCPVRSSSCASSSPNSEPVAPEPAAQGRPRSSAVPSLSGFAAPRTPAPWCCRLGPAAPSRGLCRVPRLPFALVPPSASSASEPVAPEPTARPSRSSTVPSLSGSAAPEPRARPDPPPTRPRPSRSAPAPGPGRPDPCGPGQPPGPPPPTRRRPSCFCTDTDPLTAVIGA